MNGSEDGEQRVALPVVIAGAGPVGMVLALALARFDVDVLILEQDFEIATHPKGNTHNCRTMEIYRQLGIADDVRKLGLPSNWPTDVMYMTTLRGHEIHRLSMPSTDEKLARRDSHDSSDPSPEPLHRANQMYVEREIERHVTEDPRIQCLFGMQVERFVETGEQLEIFATDRSTGKEKRFVAQYLIGSDGPTSTVRRQLGYSYLGADSLSKSFMGGPMRSTHVRIKIAGRRFIASDRAWQYWFLNPNYICNLITLDGRDEFLFTAPHLESDDPEIITKAIHAVVDDPEAEVELIASVPWMAGRALVAERYRKGHAFLCGDSTHLFTPTGGFGMNTGVDDAFNLAWKLAATIQGWGGPELLDSFESERRPIGMRNSTMARGHAANINDVELTDALYRNNSQGVAARAKCAEQLAGLREEFASIGIQLGARYDDSPIICASPEHAPPDDPFIYRPTTVPGGRLPHVWLQDGRSIHDCLGKGFTLLRFSDAIDTALLEKEAAKRNVPISVVDVPPIHDEIWAHALILVRPDMVIAWRGDAIYDAAFIIRKVTGCEPAENGGKGSDE